jgi:hypothetical protein
MSDRDPPPYVDLLRLVGVVYMERPSGAVVHRAFAIARSGSWLKLTPRLRSRVRRHVTTQRLPRTITR